MLLMLYLDDAVHLCIHLRLRLTIVSAQKQLVRFQWDPMEEKNKI